MKPLSEIVKAWRMRLAGHVLRQMEDRSANVTVNFIPEDSKRPRERPQKGGQCNHVITSPYICCTVKCCSKFEVVGVSRGGLNYTGIVVTRNKCFQYSPSIYTCLWVHIIVINMSVCLSARLCQKPHVHISPNFLFMLPVSVARFSYNNNAVHYVHQFCEQFHVCI